MTALTHLARVAAVDTHNWMKLKAKCSHNGRQQGEMVGRRTEMQQQHFCPPGLIAADGSLQQPGWGGMRASMADLESADACSRARSTCWVSASPGRSRRHLSRDSCL